jgi:hypothetical protein
MLSGHSAAQEINHLSSKVYQSKSGQTKKLSTIDMCCMFGKQAAALGGNNKDWLVLNHDIVSEWSDTSIELYC